MSIMTRSRPGNGDPYARIAELDEATVSALADRIETRAAQPRQRRLWHDFLARADFPAAARVLEVGCGTGVITAMIADLAAVAEAVGVDPSQYFIDRARARAPELHFETGDARALPFTDRSFDGVVFATTMCHIPEPDRALAEAYRVLRPGGLLLIYDGDYATATVATARIDPLQTCIDAAVRTLVHDPWLMRRLVALVRAHGFEPDQLHSHGYLETDAPSYLLSLIDFGADTLATGTIGKDTADALKAEARRRAKDGEFFGHVNYASLPARRPLADEL